ncbi:MAG: hypothetical protein ACRDSL_02585 [Pseudonocardiaceae bacterium]
MLSPTDQEVGLQGARRYIADCSGRGEYGPGMIQHDLQRGIGTASKPEHPLGLQQTRVNYDASGASTA